MHSTRAEIKINERQFVDRDGAGFVRRFVFVFCLFSLSHSYSEILRATFYFTVQSYFVDDKSSRTHSRPRNYKLKKEKNSWKDRKSNHDLEKREKIVNVFYLEIFEYLQVHLLVLYSFQQHLYVCLQNVL